MFYVNYVVQSASGIMFFLNHIDHTGTKAYRSTEIHLTSISWVLFEFGVQINFHLRNREVLILIRRKIRTGEALR